MHEQMQFIIDNYATMTYPQFAEKFGVKMITIAKRVERLKKRGLVPNERKVSPREANYGKLVSFSEKNQGVKSLREL